MLLALSTLEVFLAKMVKYAQQNENKKTRRWNPGSASLRVQTIFKANLHNMFGHKLYYLATGTTAWLVFPTASQQLLPSQDTTGLNSNLDCTPWDEWLQPPPLHHCPKTKWTQRHFFCPLQGCTCTRASPHQCCIPIQMGHVELGLSSPQLPSGYGESRAVLRNLNLIHWPLIWPFRPTLYADKYNFLHMMWGWSGLDIRHLWAIPHWMQREVSSHTMQVTSLDIWNSPLP